MSRIRPPKELKDAKRLVYIRNSLVEILEQHPTIVLGVMEGYSYGSANRKFVLGEVGAVVKLSMADADIELHGAAPTQLKKFVTGKGGASKEEVIAAVNRRWDVGVCQDDMADAYGLARIALELHNPTSVRRAELEIINKIKNKQLHKKKPRIKMASFRDAL